MWRLYRVFLVITQVKILHSRNTPFYETIAQLKQYSNFLGPFVLLYVRYFIKFDYSFSLIKFKITRSLRIRSFSFFIF